MGKLVTHLQEGRILGVNLLILVILGTQAYNFDRLLNAIEKSKIKEEIIVQSRDVSFLSHKFVLREFIDFDEMHSLINKANYVICHGGTATIIQCLELKKKIICCARLSKYGEHVDDHQMEIVSAFVHGGYILEFGENDSLDEVVSHLDEFNPQVFNSNTNKFLLKLEKKINQFLEIE